MKGKILEYNEEGRNGIISADDGSRYKLDISEWKGSSIPKAGNKVDFSVNGDPVNQIV